MSISTTNDSNLDLEARPSTATEEELQLQIALTLSREKCKKAKEMKKSNDARLQLALEESQKQVDCRATSTTPQLSALSSDPFAAWKNPAASVPSVSLISSNSIVSFNGHYIDLLQGYPMETSSAYRGGPCRLEDPSVNDSDDEDDIRRSSVDRKESQSPKQDSDPYVAWKNPAASVPSVSLISSNSINLLGGYDERSNEIERLALSLNNNCAVIPSTNKIPMMSSRTIVVAKFTYEPRLEDELGLTKGEYVYVIEKNTDGWWKGEAPNGSVGWFPSNYVEMLNDLTPPKTLSDMPIDVVGLIIEKLNYKEQRILRKTSKSLREFVDQHKPTRLDVDSCEGCTICKYNDFSVAYFKPAMYCRADLEDHTGYTLDKIISNVNYRQMAFDDLALTLKNPKVRFEVFSFFDFCERSNDTADLCHDENGNGRCDYENMQKILESNNHQLSVKACSIDSSCLSHVMSILPYLKPGDLKKITLDDDSGLCLMFEEAMEQIALLEQWKQAEELEMNCGFSECFLPKHLTHFKRFQFDEAFFDSEETFYLVIKFLMAHENFEFCSVLADSDPAVLLDRIVATPVSPNSYRYTVPDSNYYLELKIKDQLIAIEKKKK